MKGGTKILGIVTVISFVLLAEAVFASMKADIEIGAYAESGSSSSYRVVAGSSLSGESAKSATYRVDLGIIPATAVYVSDDFSFTIFVPANNATGKNTKNFAATDSIVFNITDVNGVKINATASGGQGGQQDASVSIFRYQNTGTVPINVTINFTGSVPAQITVKAGWSDASYQAVCSSKNLFAAGSCANISVGGAPQQPVIVANITGLGDKRDVWLWADYNNYLAGSDTTSNLGHASGHS